MEPSADVSIGSGIGQNTGNDDYKSGKDQKSRIFVEKDGNPDRTQNHFPEGNDRSLLRSNPADSHVVQGIAETDLYDAQDQDDGPFHSGQCAQVCKLRRQEKKDKHPRKEVG